MSVQKLGDSLFVKITASVNLTGKGELVLIGQSNGLVKYLAKKELSSTIFKTAISQSRFPEGILRLTLFSSDYQPVAERLVYIHHEKSGLNLQIKTDKPNYKPREKVKLQIMASDADGKPLEGNFSVAVTDESKVGYNEEEETTILSNLLLTSDLKGFIEKPNYYFVNTNSEKEKQLDNLLLTQGWRRFEWKEILNNKSPLISYQPEQAGNQISGKLTSVNEKKAIVNGKVLLVNSGQIINTTTNDEGKFRFDSLTFDSSSKFTLQATDARGTKEVRLELDTIASPEVIHLNHPNTINDKSFYTYLESSNKRFEEMKDNGLLKRSIGMKEVVITGYKETIQEIATKNSANLMGPGNASQVITFVDMYQRCAGDVSNCLRIVSRKTKVNQMGHVFNLRFGGEMLLVIDGVPTADTKPNEPSILMGMFSGDIESIEILQADRASIYGFRGSNGAIVITTKTGKIDYSAYEPKNENGVPRPLLTHAVRGLYAARTFYSPVYDKPGLQTKISDLRSTIYWNPQVLTDANGKATLEFYNTDGTGNFQIITEGLTNAGKLGRQVFTNQIK